MRQGFSLIEILVVIAVLAVIVGISAVSYQGSLGELELNSVAEAIVSDLRRAQSQALSGIGNADWSIDFVNPLDDEADDYYTINGSSPLDVTLPPRINFFAPTTDETITITFLRGSTQLLDDDTSIIITRAGQFKEISIESIGRITISDYEPVE